MFWVLRCLWLKLQVCIFNSHNVHFSNCYLTVRPAWFQLGFNRYAWCRLVDLQVCSVIGFDYGQVLKNCTNFSWKSEEFTKTGSQTHISLTRKKNSSDFFCWNGKQCVKFTDSPFGLFSTDHHLMKNNIMYYSRTSHIFDERQRRWNERPCFYCCFDFSGKLRRNFLDF